MAKFTSLLGRLPAVEEALRTSNHDHAYAVARLVSSVI